MTDTIQNNQPIETTQIVHEKKKRGRKPQGENGTKMSLDPQYFNNYYHPEYCRHHNTQSLLFLCIFSNP